MKVDRLDPIARISDHFGVFAAMGYTLEEACEACPYRLRMARASLIARLKARGVVFAGTRQAPARRYLSRRRKRLTITEAIRESRVPISHQAVRYRVKNLGWSLEKAIHAPLLTRAESGRLGARRAAGS